MGDGPRPTIVWLRRDLRLADNPALVEASRRGVPVVPLALWSRHDGRGRPAPGGLDAARAGTAGAASRWWLARSLTALGEELRRHGSGLLVRAADGGAEGAAASLAEFAAATRARRVVWARGVDPAQRAEDAAARRALAAIAVAATVVPSAALLADPETVRTSQGEPYKVFTPFWRAVSAAYRPPGALPVPSLPSLPADLPGGLSPADLERDAVRPWSSGFEGEWEPGEAGALARLARLLGDALGGYADDRDRPDHEGTSRLSPHLHWGELTARQVWQAVADRLAESGFEAEAAVGPPSWKEGSGQRRLATAESAASRTTPPARGLARGAAAPGAGLARDAAAFLRQLGWRDFAHHLLWHFPHTVAEPLREQFIVFPWSDDPEGLAAWQRGATGYPFVDAAMRSLWSTGWMHNRARLVAGSFLVKDLLLPWQAGAAWFWDTLVDADLADNTLGWQWVSGCGADAAPYFRIFNPVTQGRRFDPDGAFVRRWVPELAALPAEWIHAPWEAPADVLAGAGVRLGETYPAPIVDHGEARSRALAAYDVVKHAR